VASPNVNTPGAILGFLEGIKMESLIVGGAMIIAAKALISFGMFGTRRIQKYLEKRRNAIANHQPAPSVMDGRNPERYYEEKFEVPKKPMPEVPVTNWDQYDIPAVFRDGKRARREPTTAPWDRRKWPRPCNRNRKLRLVRSFFFESTP
jgi:hypothetical protein